MIDISKRCIETRRVTRKMTDDRKQLTMTEVATGREKEMHTVDREFTSLMVDETDH